jgi:hypothetical protein
MEVVKNERHRLAEMVLEGRFLGMCGRPGEVHLEEKEDSYYLWPLHFNAVGTGLWRQLLNSEHCYLNAIHVKREMK